MCLSLKTNGILTEARLAQSVERKALNLVVVGSSPTVGVAHLSNVVGAMSGQHWRAARTSGSQCVGCKLYMQYMLVSSTCDRPPAALLKNARAANEASRVVFPSSRVRLTHPTKSDGDPE